MLSSRVSGKNDEGSPRLWPVGRKATSLSRPSLPASPSSHKTTMIHRAPVTPRNFELGYWSTRGCRDLNVEDSHYIFIGHAKSSSSCSDPHLPSNGIRLRAPYTRSGEVRLFPLRTNCPSSSCYRDLPPTSFTSRRCSRLRETRFATLFQCLPLPMSSTYVASSPVSLYPSSRAPDDVPQDRDNQEAPSSP